MRMGFGLVSLLIVFAIMMILFSNNASVSVTASKNVSTVIQPMTGKDASGTPIVDTYALLAETRADGRLKDMKVTKLDPGSLMQTRFGLQANDLIVATIESHGNRDDFRDVAEDDARIHIQNVSQFGGQLIVLRGGQETTLNDATPLTGVMTAVQSPNAPAPAANNPGQQQQNPPASDDNDPMKSVRDRLKSLPGN